MIDVENLVVDTITKAVQAVYTGVLVESDYNDTPSSFPFVSVIEMDNYTYKKTQDDELQEHHAHLMYEVNVYSNKTKGKKSEAKKIMDTIDKTFQNIKFTRIIKQPIPNKDRSIYRIVARYEAVVGEGFKVGDDTIYQVYRK